MPVDLGHEVKRGVRIVSKFAQVRSQLAERIRLGQIDRETCRPT